MPALVEATELVKRFRNVKALDGCSLNIASPGLIGLVQNLPDGRVEVIAQGDKGLLHNLHEFCLKGPPRAKVLSVEVTAYEGQLGELQSFEIRY